MYGAAPHLTRLRQGDVLRGVYFPSYALGDLLLLTKWQETGELKFEKRAQLSAREAFAVVLSQCCEFNAGKRIRFSLGALRHWREALRPKPNRWGFNVAELVRVSASVWRGREANDAHMLQMLRDANRVDPATEVEAANAYLYEADGAILTEPYVVDFSQVFSVKIEEQGKFLPMKVLQLDREHRREFQLKLGVFYSRKAE